jgi:pimeloyl-ACP methyl ester carboxylesterase
MKKILYLHGLESSNVGDKVDFLKENSVVIAPSMDYLDPSLEEKLFYIIEKFQPDLIIGSSMGGYVSMLLANRYNIECILFNPAIHSRPIEPNLKSLQYDDIKHSFNPLVILGMKDDVINPLISKEILDDALSYCNIEEVEGLGHRIPLDIFVDIYNKYVI